METDSVKIRKLKGKTETEKEDTIAIEKHICVCVSGRESFFLNCTPSHLEELVLGQLFSRGEIAQVEQLAKMEISEDMEQIDVGLQPPQSGTGTEQADAPGLKSETFKIKKEFIFSTATDLFKYPSAFFRDTGCAHSCTLAIGEKVICTMEDIGRHNALDKVLGCALKHKLPLEDALIFTSGRISGDYLQKVIHAGIKIAVSRAAVTSEAIALAKRENITLLGFVRDYSGNIYNEAQY